MPEWINRTVGIANRTPGVNDATINFTPAAAGGLLVVVSGGPIVQSWPGAWTERLQPVNNTELSVATKTATAGESSVVVTRSNGNYPLAWLVYEFPAGSAWGVGTSAAGTNTAPTLSGITVGQSVFAAISGVVAANDPTPAYNSTWTTPSVEDYDATVPGDTVTDGAYVSVAYVDAYGSTSLTPAGTYGASSSREWAVWSITVPAGDTTAPTVPTGLQVTAIGATTATVSWTASTDAVGVTGYEVEVTGP
ncbi:hypothetical protein AMIS_20830 [Actinoplanes missouriensis 431]|uniref:Fibronectin type-III domain-containing protein n=1 Tax=Actinoplanes missouriensis (strain ATCC 14538 / DSM 43046 / CBS 188.64 / JCM 3121 / NBRC 102363 / NCIMB 12654 / NRRL B-3342 / UNCC 431) TaxID=512565 RepID=I0H2R6_ACTM4|nr:hypothetical protein [Actinoplanes missouriensis]BAL87303.1 hypothetical protein AMIS_20830 [Actinoplanes missouriensis 431]